MGKKRGFVTFLFPMYCIKAKNIKISKWRFTMENKIQTAAALRRALGKKDADSAKAAASAKTYSARQLITSVLDEGTFAEIGAYVKRAPESEEFEGVICGYGAIDSRLVFIFAQDFYRMKGAGKEDLLTLRTRN